MSRLKRVLLSALVVAVVAPVGANAQSPFVLSQRESASAGVTGLVQLADSGGETVRSGTGGAVITGTGAGPIVYNSGGLGTIQQFTGGGYRLIRGGVGGAIRSMTFTGRGLVVANANKLQFASSSGLSDVPHGTISDGPWISITTLPNGHILGWAWNQGWGKLYDLNLGSGAVTEQDFTGQTNDPLFNNRDNGGPLGGGPVPNAGGLAADASGGVWLAGAGDTTHLNEVQIYYAAPGGSFNSIDTGYDRAHITVTGTGTAYASNTFTGPNEGHVYKLTTSGNQGEVTSSGGKLKDSLISDLAIDRCYTTCSVTGPNVVNPGATTQKLTVPKSKTVKLGKKGLKLKLKCSIACTITISGKLSFVGKGGATAAASSLKIKKAKFKLKAGKAKTITVKLSKKQRKKVKKALRQKRKVVAKLKLVVTSKGVKTVRKPLKLRVK